MTRHSGLGTRPATEDTTRKAFEELASARQQLAAMDAEILETQIGIAQIASPTGEEHERATFVERHLEGSGLSVRTDELGNVIARVESRVPSAESPVVIAAHLDTVFPADTPLRVERRNGRVSAPGICDNARGLAGMLALARALSASERAWARPIEFVATTGEEGCGDLRGARHYVANAVRPFAMIALDGAGDDRIVNAGLGSRRFRVEYHGPGGHSWNAFGTANAIHAVTQAANALASLRLPMEGRSTLTVSRIGGGLSVNSIPADAWIEVDVRGTSEASLARIERELHAIVRAAADAENGRATKGALTFAVEPIGTRPAGETSDDAPLVRAALEATRLVQRQPVLATASTDANAAMATDVPAISIGAGGKGGDTHTTREWYENVGATAGLQRALTLVSTMASLPERA